MPLVFNQGPKSEIINADAHAHTHAHNKKETPAIVKTNSQIWKKLKHSEVVSN